jgi:hypothetical protein
VPDDLEIDLQEVEASIAANAIAQMFCDGLIRQAPIVQLATIGTIIHEMLPHLAQARGISPEQVMDELRGLITPNPPGYGD